jgi:hypothetical protein
MKGNLPFDLTFDAIEALYEKQPFDALTRQEFDLTTKAGTVSIDQVNPGGGYTVDNVRLLRAHTNLALNKYGDAAFDDMCLARVKAMGYTVTKPG